MSYVASLSLCKELYELSRWDNLNLDDWVEEPRSIEGTPKIAPKYTLGYLMRKLPSQLPDDIDAPLQLEKFGGGWLATYPDGDIAHRIITDTPEDSLCRLAIELFKQGILVAHQDKPKGAKGKR